MKFEIINPSDECYVSGEFIDVCCAVALLGNGQYGAGGEDGKLKMPIFIIGGFGAWFMDTFKISWSDYLASNEQKIVDVLNTFEYSSERTSMTNIGAIAKTLSKAISDKITELGK